MYYIFRKNILLSGGIDNIDFEIFKNGSNYSFLVIGWIINIIYLLLLMKITQENIFINHKKMWLHCNDSVWRETRCKSHLFDANSIVSIFDSILCNNLSSG